MYNKTRPQNEKGSIVLGALAISTLIAIFAGTIATQIKSSDDMTQLPRIRATMAQLEVQTRLAAYSATSYDCDYYPTGYACKLDKSVFNNIKADVNGGTIKVITPAFEPTQNRFTARIQFQVVNASQKRFQIAPRDINIVIPSELLQPVTFRCPTARPVFAGFYDKTENGHKKGEAICKAFSTATCGPGQFMSSINPATLEPTCAPAGGSVSCAADQFMSKFTWNGAGGITFECTGRKDPFSEMGWNYLDSTTVDNSSPLIDPDQPDPLPPPLPADDIVSWSAPATQPASTCYAPPVINCVGNFTGCSATCGGGTDTFIVTQPAQNGGAACQYTNNYTLACNQQACTVPPTATPTPAPPSWPAICSTGTMTMTGVIYTDYNDCMADGESMGDAACAAIGKTYCGCGLTSANKNRYQCAAPAKVWTPTDSGHCQHFGEACSPDYISGTIDECGCFGAGSGKVSENTWQCKNGVLEPYNKIHTGQCY